MKVQRLFQVMMFSATMFCLTASAQTLQRATVQKQTVTQVSKSQPGRSIAPATKAKATTAKGFRTTTAVKLRKSASSKASTVKNRKGQMVIIPAGASIKYVSAKGNFYKVAYNGYTGYIAKKYTTGRSIKK